MWHLVEGNKMIGNGVQSRGGTVGRRQVARVAAIAAIAALALVAVTGQASVAAAQDEATCFGLPATIVGTNVGEIIQGTPGNDVIVALGGRDTINGMGGDDTICAGPGNDLVRAGAGEDRVYGEGGNDRLYGDADNDELDGGDGRDRVYGGDGDDELDGGADRDRLDGGNGDDELTDSDGSTIAVGGNGDDVIEITAPEFNRIIAGNGDNIVIGGNGREAVTAGTGDDQINTGDGNDLVVAGAGDDQIDTGLGNDRVRAGSGDDTISDPGGANLLYGDQGDDMIEGGPDNDRAYGGSGDDVVNGNDGSDRVYGQTGNDRLSGGPGTNFVDGGPQFDLCDLGDGGTIRLCEGELNDGEAPSIEAPADVIVEAAGPQTAVDIGVPTVVDDDDPNPPVINDAPDTFPVGVTTVTWTATDASGNEATATQTVTVEDTTPPALVAPAPIGLTIDNVDNVDGVPADDPAIVAFLAGVSATDLVDQSPTITNDGPQLYPLGQTIVTFTAVDAAGNEATATAGVTISSPVTGYSGVIWRDLDGDAVQSPGDEILINVAVEQYSNGVLIGTVFTNPDGKYDLGQPLGDGYLRIAIPEGLSPVTPGVGDEDELDSDFSFATIDGFVEASAPGGLPGSRRLDAGFSDLAVGGFVWSDDNGNGLRDRNELGLERVVVELFDSEDKKVDSTLTDSGAYEFTQVPEAHVIRVVAPAGYTPTAQDVGDDDTIDSDIDANGQASIPRLYAGPGSGIDAGLALIPRSITVNPTSGLVTGEDGTTASFTVVLDVQPSTVVTIPVASSNVAEGKTDVEELAFSPTNWNIPQTVAVGGIDDALDDGDVAYTIELGPASGGYYTGVDPADVSLVNIDDDEFASVSGFIWLDGNGDGDNGLQDDGEPGIDGVEVNLHGPDVRASIYGYTEGPVLQTTTTGANGLYSFSVPVGEDDESVVVRFVDPPGHLRVEPNVGDDDTIDSDFPYEPDGGFEADAGVAIDLGPGDAVDIDAGYRAGPPVTGVVWNDLDGNGLRDAGEPGLGGVHIAWEEDGQFSVSEQTVSNPDGSYEIVLTPANGYLTVEAPTDLASVLSDNGDDDTIDSDFVPRSDGDAALRVVVSQGNEARVLDAGFTEPTITIGDFVWDDLNENGLQDDGEPGVEDVTVNIYNTSTDSVEATTTTDEFGFYSLSVPVALGTRNLQVIPPAEATFTETDVGDDDTIDSDIVASSGRRFLRAGAGYRTNLDAGLVFSRANIRGIVWDDTNQDGIRDTDEPAVGSVAVRLLAADTLAVVAETTTESASVAAGIYEFVADPGQYLVEVVAPTGFGFSPANEGSDDTVDSDIENATTGRTATLTIDASNAFKNVDAGLIPLPGTIGGFVWVDVPRNDVQDGDELGIANVEVRLHGPNIRQTVGSSAGPILQTTTTNADGLYSFSVPVASGGERFVVRFIDPLGHARVTANVGDDDTIDSILTS